MRYTTLIDIREVPEVYRNQNTRLVYLHLVLVSGYHEGDRDQVQVSIRALAGQVGLSVSAVRNALEQLGKYGLVSRQGGTLRVTKYVIPDEYARKVPKSKQAAQLQAIADERRRKEDQERKARLQEVYKAAEESSPEELAEWLQQMEGAREGATVYHRGAGLPNTQQAREWLQAVIKQRKKNNK